MKKGEKISLVMLGMLHQILVLERATWLVYSIGYLIGKGNQGDLDSGGSMAWLNSGLFGEEQEGDKVSERNAACVHYAREINSHLRAFSNVVLDQGADPVAVTKNLPASSNRAGPYGNSKTIKMICEVCETMIKDSGADPVFPEMVDELEHWYGIQLGIFNAKF